VHPQSEYRRRWEKGAKAEVKPLWDDYLASLRDMYPEPRVPPVCEEEGA